MAAHGVRITALNHIGNTHSEVLFGLLVQKSVGAQSRIHTRTMHIPRRTSGESVVDEAEAKTLAGLCGYNALALSLVAGLIGCGVFDSEVSAHPIDLCWQASG